MKIKAPEIKLGADPEFFLIQNKQIIGAEKIIPKEGLFQKQWDGVTPYKHPSVIIDGVQAEFNFEPFTCRQDLSREIARCFKVLHNHLPSGIEMSFAHSAVISEKEMKSLSPENRVLGCDPSLNAYGIPQVKMNSAAKKYVRNVGGHIHLGGYHTATREKMHRNADFIVRMLDVLVGNTFVLVDHDPGNIIRRQTYGRAGEYRMPAHGLEYRVPSNFWLHNYTMMSFAMAMARFGLHVALDEKVSALILEHVNFRDIQKAINTNDAELAYKNFSKIKHIIADIQSTSGSRAGSYPLEGERVKAFEKFIKKGMLKTFPQNPVEHWLSGAQGGSGIGWESFIGPTVKTLFVSNLTHIVSTNSY